MSKKNIVVFLVVVAMLLISACSSNSEPVLSVSGLSEGSFTQKDLENFDVVNAEYTKKDGSVKEYSGVLISEILKSADVAEYSMLSIIASDGYEAEISSEELENCVDCILAYDDEDGWGTIMPDFSGKLQVKSVIELKAE